MNRFIVLSGCSGGGKSTLLEALAQEGYSTVEEPGRRIVAQSLAGDGQHLPWVDLAAFARRAIEVALTDREQAEKASGPVFFDRGLVDAASALQMATGDDAWLRTLATAHRYHRIVFLTPPWPEIYRTDGERQHDFSRAVTEYDRLADLYPRLDYETVILPKTDVAERVRVVLDRLASTS